MALFTIVTGELHAQFPPGICTVSPSLAEFTADCTLASEQLAALIVADSALAPAARNTTAKINVIHPILLFIMHLLSSDRGDSNSARPKLYDPKRAVIFCAVAMISPCRRIRLCLYAELY
jgi:hypothetical protein